MASSCTSVSLLSEASVSLPEKAKKITELQLRTLRIFLDSLIEETGLLEEEFDEYGGIYFPQGRHIFLSTHLNPFWRNIAEFLVKKGLSVELLNKRQWERFIRSQIELNRDVQIYREVRKAIFSHKTYLYRGYLREETFRSEILKKITEAVSLLFAQTRHYQLHSIKKTFYRFENLEGPIIQHPYIQALIYDACKKVFWLRDLGELNPQAHPRLWKWSPEKLALLRDSYY